MTLVLQVEGDVKESGCPRAILVRRTDGGMEIALLMHAVTYGDYL
jgi:hypothetical protein